MTQPALTPRFSHLVLAALLFACGDDKGTTTTAMSEGTSSTTDATGAVPTGTGDASTTGDTTTGTSTTGDVPTGTAETGTGGFACSPGEACEAVDRTCIGLVDNAGQTTFGLRISQLDVAAPSSLMGGIVGSIISGSVTPALPACNLTGGATFNLLLQFDTAASTLKIGGAKPVNDPAGGYSFVDEIVDVFTVEPATYANVQPDAGGAFWTATGASLAIPMYLDAKATDAVIFPLEQARVVMGTLSASHNCIGDYNAEGLDPESGCLADAMNPTFHTNAALEAFISLEAADQMVVAGLKQSLCVLLSGDPAKYGEFDVDANNTFCKRTGDMINFKGDWCAGTNNIAHAECSDAVRFTAEFAASSVLIK